MEIHWSLSLKQRWPFSLRPSHKVLPAAINYMPSGTLLMPSSSKPLSKALILIKVYEVLKLSDEKPPKQATSSTIAWEWMQPVFFCTFFFSGNKWWHHECLQKCKGLNWALLIEGTHHQISARGGVVSEWPDEYKSMFDIASDRGVEFCRVDFDSALRTNRPGFRQKKVDTPHPRPLFRICQMHTRYRSAWQISTVLDDFDLALPFLKLFQLSSFNFRREQYLLPSEVTVLKIKV